MVKLVKFKDITNEEGLPIGYACYNNNTLVGFCTLQKNIQKSIHKFVV